MLGHLLQVFSVIKLDAQAGIVHGLFAQAGTDITTLPSPRSQSEDVAPI